MRSPLQKLNRRKFLVGSAGVLGTALLARNHGRAGAAPLPPVSPSSHLVWVWQFNEDGDAESIRDALAAHGAGILLKTHDGTHWMSRWDDSPMAIDGGRSIENAARLFENAAVPFHAWCVVKGEDPMEEARMCAEVLRSGARSLTFDLEAPDEGHYWQAGSAEAAAFGQELRRLVPDARLSVAPDPRPWQLEEVPMREFAGFTNEIAPQTYWETFSSPTNRDMLRERGFEVTDEGVTPELILNVSQQSLASFGRPIRPVGQGNSSGAAWQRFVGHARKLGMSDVSVWRYGTMASEVLPLLASASAPSIAESKPKAESLTGAIVPAIQPPGIAVERARQATESARSLVRASADNAPFQTDWGDVVDLNPSDNIASSSSAGTSSTKRNWFSSLTKRGSAPEGVEPDASSGTHWKWILPDRPTN